jgi:hypothetical protein
MLRTTMLSAAGLAAVLAAPAVAAGTPGPFVGTVAQGQTKTHLYDNNPTKSDCIQLAVPYTVSVTYAPSSDTLTLSVGSLTATGSNGSARLSFVGSTCTSFAVSVTGTSVARTAAYVVTVSSGSSGSR